MTASGIYMIWNSADRRVYVGGTADLERRQRQHWSCLNRDMHKNAVLQKAWADHGPEMFDFIVLKIAAVRLLPRWEQYFIDLLDAANPLCGYNACPRADTTFGFRWSKETRERFRRKKGGRPISDAQRTHMAELAVKRRGSKRPDVKVNASRYSKFLKDTVWKADELYIGGATLRGVGEVIEASDPTVLNMLRRSGPHYITIPFRSEQMAIDVAARLAARSKKHKSDQGEHRQNGADQNQAAN